MSAKTPCSLCDSCRKKIKDLCKRAGAEEERARIVAWLGQQAQSVRREYVKYPLPVGMLLMLLDTAAVGIKEGEHLGGDEPMSRTGSASKGEP